MRIRRPTHATVVAYLALFVALGGSAIAVTRVGTNDLMRGAVTSSKIKDHAVRGKDLARIVLRAERRFVAAGNTALATAIARCRKREQFLAGAGGWIGDGNLTSAIAFKATDSYEVRGTNPDGSADSLLAQAICLRR
jgi:hypothetical protein